MRSVFASLSASGQCLSCSYQKSGSGAADFWTITFLCYCTQQNDTLLSPEKGTGMFQPAVHEKQKTDFAKTSSALIISIITQ